MAPEVPGTNPSHTASWGSAWNVLGSGCLPISRAMLLYANTSAADQGERAEFQTYSPHSPG
jgi:hypothetical protein